MKLPHLDDIDQQIVQLLLENGRMPYAKIGETLSLSRVAIQKRVESLLESGVLEHFTVRVNVAKLGRTVSAFFEVQVEPRCVDSVGQRLSEEMQVVNIYQMTGSSTLHVHALLRDENELEKFLYDKLYVLEGVVNVQTQLMIRKFKSASGLDV